MIRWMRNGTDIFAIIWLMVAAFLIFSKLTGLITYSWFAIILIIFLPALISLVLFAFLVSADIIMFGKAAIKPPQILKDDDKDDDLSK